MKLPEITKEELKRAEQIIDGHVPAFSFSDEGRKYEIFCDGTVKRNDVDDPSRGARIERHCNNIYDLLFVFDDDQVTHSDADASLGWTQEKEDDGTWKVCTQQAEEPNATEVNSLLIQALALLENVLTDSEGEDDQEKEEDEEYRMILTWAAHEHVQRAWNLYSGHDDPHQLSEVTRGCVAIRDACVATEAREQVEAARKT